MKIVVQQVENGFIIEARGIPVDLAPPLDLRAGAVMPPSFTTKTYVARTGQQVGDLVAMLFAKKEKPK